MLELEKEKQKKSIPAKVFKNHFLSLKKKIENDTNRHNLNELHFFRSQINQPTLDNPKYEKIKKLLWNSWSTEYALKTSLEFGTMEYLNFSLHWSFPQAYYSAYLAMSAFHETQNKAKNNHDKSIKEFGNDVMSERYPVCVGYYASGDYDGFTYYGLPNFREIPKSFNGLTTITSIQDAEKQIALFLKTTREKEAENKKIIYQQKNHKSFRKKDGETPRSQFNRYHWNLIYNNAHFTTLMNLLYRLRIKANYHEIDTFVEADINYKEFLNSIIYIVEYCNFVHEAYIAKSIGRDTFSQIINSFPNHFFEENANSRFNRLITPLLY